MKLRGFIFTLVVGVVIALGLTSCKGGYTCPTYLQNDNEVQDVEMVKSSSITEGSSI